MERQTQRHQAFGTVIASSSQNASLPVHKISGTETATANASAALPVERGAFYQEGEYWTLVLGGRRVRLKDAKGLAYLAYLLRHPGTEFHVLDLAGGIADRAHGYEFPRSRQGLARRDEDLERAGIHIGGLRDAAEILDEQAKTAYRQRLSVLREELEEAKALGQVDKAEQLEEELDSLTSELSLALGLGGRNRRVASASERARQTVTKTIRG